MVGATAVATVAVASGVAAASPDSAGSHAAPHRPALSEERVSAADLAHPASQLTDARARLATMELTRLAQERREAARRAAKRRAAAAARRAAQRAAQQQAAQQQAAQQSAQQPAGSTVGSATPSGSPQQIAMAMLGSFGWPSSQRRVTPTFRTELNIPGMDTVGLERTETRNGSIVSSPETSACDRNWSS